MNRDRITEPQRANRIDQVERAARFPALIALAAIAGWAAHAILNTITRL